MANEKFEQDSMKISREQERKDVENNKFWAVLAYLGILVVIPLAIKKDSPFCQFHARQGLIILIGWVLSWFPIFGWVLGIIAFVLSVVGIIAVLYGEKRKLPLIGELAEEIKL